MKTLPISTDSPPTTRTSRSGFEAAARFDSTPRLCDSRRRCSFSMSKTTRFRSCTPE
jgi:hypothetical protein